MKKWKQILALTLAVVVTLSVVPVGDARAAVEEPTEYAIVGEIINADGAEITVKEYLRMAQRMLNCHGKS